MREVFIIFSESFWDFFVCFSSHGCSAPLRMRMLICKAPNKNWSDCLADDLQASIFCLFFNFFMVVLTSCLLKRFYLGSLQIAVSDWVICHQVYICISVSMGSANSG